MTAMDERPQDGLALVNEIEGHLLLAAARDEARAAATRLSERLYWLTNSQRDDLERQFETAYLGVARTSWLRTVERGEELRREYEATYRVLRQRLVAGFLFCCAVLAGTGMVVLALT